MDATTLETNIKIAKRGSLEGETEAVTARGKKSSSQSRSRGASCDLVMNVGESGRKRGAEPRAGSQSANSFGQWRD